MNTYFIITFAIIMLVAIGWFWKIRHRQVNALASIVTVIGVLGTFLGIAIGLYQFDTQNIEESVPKLLEGLKIAFITSILGIIGSITLKWSTLNNRKSQAASEETYTGATVDDLAELLQNILTVEQEEGKETRETLRSIERSLTGESDTTMLTQLQKLRTTFSDKQDDLIRAFNEFAEQIAENNTNALIEALEEVMRDFNAKINEQFGENFKQLNEAVGRINEWQEQYRQQMDELAAEFKVAIVVNTDGKLQKMIDEFSTIVKERIDDSHASMENQREALNEFSSMVRESIDNSYADMIRQREAFQTFTGRIEDIIRRTHQGLESTLVDTNQKLENTLEAQSRQLSAETQRIFQENGERLSRQIQGFDEALQGELTRALESLASQLTSLSSRFVEDYSPLTEKLRDVVQIASDLPQISQHQQRRREV